MSTSLQRLLMKEYKSTLRFRSKDGVSACVGVPQNGRSGESRIASVEFVEEVE